MLVTCEFAFSTLIPLIQCEKACPACRKMSVQHFPTIFLQTFGLNPDKPGEYPLKPLFTAGYMYLLEFSVVLVTLSPCCMYVCLVRMHLYQWSDDVVRTVVRSEWKVRSGHVDKVAHIVVTPAVTVSFSVTVL